MKYLSKILFLIYILCPLMVSAMKIETDEVDEFTGKRTLITSWESICKSDIHIRFRMQNGVQRLDFKMVTRDGTVVGEGDKLLFKSTKDNIGEFSSVSTYPSTIGGGSVGMASSKAWGIFATYKGDLSYFSENVIRLIRMYSVDAYRDKTVGENDGKKIQKLYDLFTSAIEQEAGRAARYSDYTLTYVTSTNGGKTWDVVEEKFFKDLSPEDVQEKINEWKAKSSDKRVYDCRAKKEH